jgi:uncharacterized protein YkwD
MHGMRRFVAVSVVAVLCLGGVGTARASHDDGLPASSTESAVFGSINRARANRGLNKLELNAVIRREARAHSFDMADDEELSHDGFAERVARITADDSGVDGRRLCELVAGAVGTPTQAARRIFRKWIETSDRRCLLDRLGFTTQSGAVGVWFKDGRYWATFIAAHDTNP